nr:hypothetical protein CPGR_02392 [Mycolicibacter nonchromogenicus]
MVTHSAENSSHAPNFIRSATAPEINATVMIANIIWKPTKTVAGTVPTSGISNAAVPLAGSAATPSMPMRPLSPQ